MSEGDVSQNPVLLPLHADLSVPKKTNVKMSLLNALPVDDEARDVLNPFLVEFQKLQQALKKSHESEDRFIKKCKDLVKGVQISDEKLKQLAEASVEHNRLAEEMRGEIQHNTDSRAEIQTEIGKRKKDIKGKSAVYIICFCLFISFAFLTFSSREDHQRERSGE